LHQCKAQLSTRSTDRAICGIFEHFDALIECLEALLSTSEHFE
jgi:hypothetical protein